MPELHVPGREANVPLEGKDLVCHPTWFEISALTSTFINRNHPGRGWQAASSPAHRSGIQVKNNLSCGTKASARGESHSLCVPKAPNGRFLERCSIKLHCIINFFFLCNPLWLHTIRMTATVLLLSGSGACSLAHGIPSWDPRHEHSVQVLTTWNFS